MRKLLVLIFTFTLTLFVAACGDEGNVPESNDGNTNVEETMSDEMESDSESNEAAKENDEGDSGDKKETEDGHSVGDTISSEGGDSTLTSLSNDIGEFESGPIVMNIRKANGVHLDIHDKDIKDFFDGQDELEYIQVDMEVENTSEDHITFYASQAVMTTNTGEQLEPDMWFSDHIEGEFLGKVKKSGSSFYILENSKAKDVESIKLFYDAAIDENWDEVGDKIEVEIELNK